MKPNVLFEMELILLFIFSVTIPIGIYIFLYKKIAISRWTVVAFALLLVVIAGGDVVLLQSLAESAKGLPSMSQERMFSGQLSLMLYLLPAAFAGLGVNLVSHVLINHLNEAEAEFDKYRREPGRRGTDGVSAWTKVVSTSEGMSERWVLIGSAVAEAIIFILDLSTGADIRLHVLYIFPLALVARYCAARRIVFAAVALTSVLQVVTFAIQISEISNFLTDVVVSLSASLLITFLARQARQSYLTAVSQAVTDPLTLLPNRRAFIAAVDVEIARQKRYGDVFTLALIDLDGFKALNDSQGHHAGDEALKVAADALRTCTRESDSISRIGGDEFAVLMPNTRNEDCSTLFTQLCTTISSRMTAAGFDVTASIGCKAFNSPPDSTSHALQMADELMYQAKNGGKNQTVHA